MPNNLGTMGTAAELPGYSPLTDPDLLAQGAIRRLRDQQQQLLAEAHAYALGQHNTAQQAFGQLQQAQQQPMQSPISPMAALPYMANAFAAGFSNHPEHQVAADRQVAMTQDQLMQRRQEMLNILHEKYMQAAQQADQAGDVERSLQFTNKANTSLKEYELLTSQADRRAKMQDERTLMSQRQQFESGENVKNRAFQAAQSTRDNMFRAWMESQNSPAMRAELEILNNAFASRAKALETRLSFGGQNLAADRASAAQELEAAAQQGMTDVQGVVKKYSQPMPTENQGANRAPEIAPKALQQPHSEPFHNPFTTSSGPMPNESAPGSAPAGGSSGGHGGSASFGSQPSATKAAPAPQAAPAAPTAAPTAAPQPTAAAAAPTMTEQVFAKLQEMGITSPEAIRKWSSGNAASGRPMYQELMRNGVSLADLMTLSRAASPEAQQAKRVKAMRDAVSNPTTSYPLPRGMSQDTAQARYNLPGFITR